MNTVLGPSPFLHGKVLGPGDGLGEQVPSIALVSMIFGHRDTGDSQYTHTLLIYMCTHTCIYTVM